MDQGDKTFILSYFYYPIRCESNFIFKSPKKPLSFENTNQKPSSVPRFLPSK